MVKKWLTWLLKENPFSSKGGKSEKKRDNFHLAKNLQN